MERLRIGRIASTLFVVIVAASAFGVVSWTVTNQFADVESTATRGDGRKVKFIYQELPNNGEFLTELVEGNAVVYSVVLTKARNPLSRKDVESRFERGLSKK